MKTKIFAVAAALAFSGFAAAEHFDLDAAVAEVEAGNFGAAAGFEDIVFTVTPPTEQDVYLDELTGEYCVDITVHVSKTRQNKAGKTVAVVDEEEVETVCQIVEPESDPDPV